MSNPFDNHPRVRMLWPDHLGLARGKYVPGRLAHKGSGFCVTTFAMAYDRDLIPAPGGYLLEGLKDLHAEIDASTLRPGWEDDRTGVAIADLSIEGEPYAVSSRHALRRSLDAWAELGFSVKVGIELEGYLMEPDGDRGWKRYSNPRAFVYGTGPLGDPSGFVDEVLVTAEQMGISVESCNVEFDESQFEFTLEYDDAMQAADDAFLFRVMAREVAIRNGLDFTFLGKPFPGVAGSGIHTNFSLVDEDGNPALVDDDGEHGLSDVARGCLAGLIRHHKALTAISAPIVNSYRRLQPGELAGCWANWGIDHRNVTNRVPADAGDAMRIESRLGDGAMGVHLGVAGVLEAARLGVVNSYDCPPAYQGDGFEDGGGCDRSADSLSAALDDLEADPAFIDAVGAELIANFLANKRHEAERFAASGAEMDPGELSTFELAQHLPYH